jgi:hypothetical protein
MTAAEGDDAADGLLAGCFAACWAVLDMAETYLVTENEKSRA